MGQHDVECLRESVAGLDTGVLLEATGLFATSIGVVDANLSPEPGINLSRADLISACRLCLSVAAGRREYCELLWEAIDGAGRKQSVLTDAETIVFAVLSLGALHVLVSRGKTSEKQEIEVEVAADGTEKVVIKNVTEYGISDALAKMLRSIIGASEDTPKSVDRGTGDVSDQP